MEKDIDWEERRWNLATSIYLRYANETIANSLKIADNFIRYYKDYSK